MNVYAAIRISLNSISWPDYGLYHDADIWDSESDAYDPPSAHDVNVIERLTARYIAGLPVDPIQVRLGLGRAYAYDLEDGWHRIQAAIGLGWDSLPTLVLA